MPRIYNFSQSLLSRRLLAYVVSCALLFSLISTAAQLIFSHNRAVADLHRTFKYIDNSYVGGIAASLFSLDEEQLRLQVKGILNFPHIEYAKVTEQRGMKRFQLEEGDALASQDFVQKFPLTYNLPERGIVSYGELTVAANFDRINTQMWEDGLIAFITSVVGLGLVSFCIYLIFQYTITRHLISMCEFTDKLSLNQLDRDFHLHRKPPKLWQKDELFQLSKALNKMRSRLKKDLLDLQLREKTLKENEASLLRYEHIISSTNDLMSFVDKDYRYQAVNDAYLTAHSKKRSEIVGYRVDQLMGREIFRPLVKPNFDRALGGEIIQYQSWFDYPGLGRRYMDVTYYPFNSNSRECDGVVVSAHDLTQRKAAEDDKLRLESQLRQAQKIESIGTLAGGIAHDFNNILSAIIGYAELALNDARVGSTMEAYVQEILSAGNRATDLVRQILAFARQSEEERHPVKVSSIVIEVLKLIRSSIPTTIDIHEDISSDAHVMGNATQLQQVLMNLCTNAAQAMEHGGGTLNVSLNDVMIDKKRRWANIALPAGEYIEMSVSDTGPGISPDIIDNIFEPYFTTKGPGEGTGMGLAVANGIVENYGGKIMVTSDPDKKTVFSLYLPITGGRQIPIADISKPLPKGHERILVVDDEAPIANMTGRILEQLGYTVETRTSSVEALERFRSRPEHYDLIITDMTMPNMTGDILAAEMIALKKDIPIIMCSGYSKKISEEMAMEIGIQAFAYKPVVSADLAEIVRNVLDKHGSRAQRISDV